MIGTITFNPSIDQHIIVEHLVKDDANRAKAIFRYPGGKGINVSKVVRELGGKTHAFALLGGRTGDFLIDLLEELDIPFSRTNISGNTRINTILTDIQDGTQTRISAPGPKVSEKDLKLFLKKLRSVRPKPFLWAFGGSLPAGMRPTAYQDFITVLQKEGVPCVLDTDDEALKMGVKAKPFMIKPNEYEMQRLVGDSLSSISSYFKAAKSLVKKGVGVVVVSLGERGALFVTCADSFYLEAIKVPVKSKVGAGDSLIGGFTYGLWRKMSFTQAACLGVAASASAVMREAPRLCRREDIPALLKKIKVKRL